VRAGRAARGALAEVWRRRWALLLQCCCVLLRRFGKLHSSDQLLRLLVLLGQPWHACSSCIGGDASPPPPHTLVASLSESCWLAHPQTLPLLDPAAAAHCRLGRCLLLQAPESILRSGAACSPPSGCCCKPRHAPPPALRLPAWLAGCLDGWFACWRASFTLHYLTAGVAAAVACHLCHALAGAAPPHLLLPTVVPPTHTRHTHTPPPPPPPPACAGHERRQPAS
jgi:hypothetical protein